MDLLVKLYNLPSSLSPPGVDVAGVTIRPALPGETNTILRWVTREFSVTWAGECQVAITKGTCLIAVEGRRLVGFSCYDATALGFFGPTGVTPSCRKKGIGKALLLHALYAMKTKGYGYAIIGGVGPVEFYAKCAAATPIEGSTPGIYPPALEEQ